MTYVSCWLSKRVLEIVKVCNCAFFQDTITDSVSDGLPDKSTDSTRITNSSPLFPHPVEPGESCGRAVHM